MLKNILIFSVLAIFSLEGRDLISIEDFNRREIEQILGIARRFKIEKDPDHLKGFILASCFFEPSTRTRLSFEAAMQRLGGSCVGFSESTSTSMKKGESLLDTMKTVDQYADILIIRHPQAGSARAAAEVCSHPVINAGDGANEHPTQALTDLFTIYECQGRIEDLHIAFMGDLKYARTAHSLCLALSHFSVHLHFLPLQGFEPPQEILQKLNDYSFHDSLEEILPKIDILYLTRQQKERFTEGEMGRCSTYQLREEQLQGAKKNLRILHPFPRTDEIEPAVDHTPYAYYFQQMKNGVFVRMALLSYLIPVHYRNDPTKS